MTKPAAPKASPKLGDKVFVWPRERTVRDAARKPVKDGNGVVQKKLAHLRNSGGMRIVGRTFVTVDLHTLSLINSRNLDWCTAAEQREYLRKKPRADVVLEQKSVEKNAQQKKKSDASAASTDSADT